MSPTLGAMLLLTCLVGPFIIMSAIAIYQINTPVERARRKVELHRARQQAAARAQAQADARRRDDQYWLDEARKLDEPGPDDTTPLHPHAEPLTPAVLVNRVAGVARRVALARPGPIAAGSGPAEGGLFVTSGLRRGTRQARSG